MVLDGAEDDEAHMETGTEILAKRKADAKRIVAPRSLDESKVQDEK